VAKVDQSENVGDWSDQVCDDRYEKQHPEERKRITVEEREEPPLTPKN
jgi:hypothetical protein